MTQSALSELLKIAPPPCGCSHRSPVHTPGLGVPRPSSAPHFFSQGRPGERESQQCQPEGQGFHLQQVRLGASHQCQQKTDTPDHHFPVLQPPPTRRSASVPWLLLTRAPHLPTASPPGRYFSKGCSGVRCPALSPAECLRDKDTAVDLDATTQETCKNGAF